MVLLRLSGSHPACDAFGIEPAAGIDKPARAADGQTELHRDGKRFAITIDCGD
jgi:hypothetical protein